MRKKWLKVFLLCVTCIICLQEHCFAEEEKENWVQFYYKGDWEIFYVDTNSIKPREYEGRKHLDVKVRRREKTVEQLILVNRWIEVKNAEWHTLYDIQSGNSVSLEWWDKYHNPDKGTSDISEIKTAPWPQNEIGDKLIGWVNQYYPAILTEIRVHNQQYAAQHPQANEPTGTVADGAKDVTPNGIGENLPPNTLEEQPLLEIGEEVKIPIRIHPEWTYSAWKNPFDDVAYEYGVGRYYINEDGRRRACPDLYLLKLPTCKIASRPRKISIQGPERTLCSQVWLETTP